jgi:ribonuclease HI
VTVLMRDDPTMSVTAGQGDESGAQDRAEVVRRELLLLDPAVRADLGRVRRLLHPDLVEFGASGRVWDAASLADAVAAGSEPLAQGVVADLVPVSLSIGAVLLTYRIVGPVRPSLRSSVWLRSSEGEWLLRFHQGTPSPSPE